MIVYSVEKPSKSANCGWEGELWGLWPSANAMQDGCRPKKLHDQVL